MDTPTIHLYRNTPGDGDYQIYNRARCIGRAEERRDPAGYAALVLAAVELVRLAGGTVRNHQAYPIPGTES